LAAVYTAFLFAQAKGRDFWQNPLLSVHLLAHALLAGAVVWVVTAFSQGGEVATPRPCLIAALVFSLVSLLAELLTTPPTADARMAMDWIVRNEMFLGLGVAGGHILPLGLLILAGSGQILMAAAWTLVGLYVIEWLWVHAPQRVPL